MERAVILLKLTTATTDLSLRLEFREPLQELTAIWLYSYNKYNLKEFYFLGHIQNRILVDYIHMLGLCVA